jgi:hypothetical protein
MKPVIDPLPMGSPTLADYSEALADALAQRDEARKSRDALETLARDMLSTYRDDAKEVLVTTERMEAWEFVLNNI